MSALSGSAPTTHQSLGDHELAYRTLCQVLAGQPNHVGWSGFSLADWDLLVETARSEGVAPLLYHALNTAGWPEQMPAHLRRDLQATYYATAARNLLIYEELSRILTALSPLRVVVLKGAALADTLYPSIALRPMGDLDLLVPRQHLESAVQALQSLGYEREAGQDRIPGFNRVVGFNVHLRGGRRQPLTVELHWNLVAGDTDWRSPRMDWFWEQTEEWKTEVDNWSPSSSLHSPSSALQLTATAHLLYLAAHLMLQHGGAQARLLWFYDIHLLVSQWKSRLDWDELLDRACQFRWAAALHAALQGAQNRFATSLPNGFLDTLAEATDHQARQLVERKAGTVQTRATTTWDKLTSMGWSTRVYLARSIVFPSSAYLRLRYKPHPAWLWPLYYPYRWFDILREGLTTLWRIGRGRMVGGRGKDKDEEAEVA